MAKLKVLNPEGYPPKVSATGMAPSLDTLDGKKLFLVDVGFANSDNFMAQLNGWLEEHREVLGLGARHHRVHRDLLDVVAPELHADGRARLPDHLVGGVARAGEHRLDALLGRQDDREEVGVAALLEERTHLGLAVRLHVPRLVAVPGLPVQLPMAVR